MTDNPRKSVADTAGADPREHLERVRDRDPEALESFFEAYFDDVYALAIRLLGDQHTAQDVTQEVFFKVHRAAHQLDPSRDPKPWLTAITYNTCREFWRSGNHKMSMRTVSIQDQPEIGYRVRSTVEDPESRLLTLDREKRVQAAIRDLPEPLRVAVLLHDYEGMGHEEVAAVTGVSHAAARKRYSRALSELGKRLRRTIGGG